MQCPHCQSLNISPYQKRTHLSYPIYRCLDCKTMFNERTGPPFNNVQYSTDIVMWTLEINFWTK